jgi:hypothetical protein
MKDLDISFNYVKKLQANIWYFYKNLNWYIL